MAWRLANSLTRLRDQLNAKYPSRSRASDGTIGDAAHAASASDHNPNGAGVVCAMDITHDPKNGLDIHALADKLLVSRHPNLKYIISNGRIAGAWTGWRWTQYLGSNRHDKHAHFSVGVGNDGASQQPYDNTQDWNINLNGGITMDSSDALETFVAAFHRKPGGNEANQWIGNKPDKVAVSIKNQPEWLSQNHILLVAYPEAIKQLADASNRLRQLTAHVDALTKQDVVDAQQLANANAEAKKARDQLETATVAATKAHEDLLKYQEQHEAAQKAGNAFTLWIGEQINKIFGAK